MSFSSVLNEYCERLGCTNKALAAECGISASTISRYRNGERTPTAGSLAVTKLARGLARISEERLNEPLKADDVRTELQEEISGSSMVGMDLNMRLDALMHLLGISNVELAAIVGVDPSYISRIRSGRRTPADRETFADRCAHFAARVCIDRALTDDLAELIGASDLIHEYPDWGISNFADMTEAIEVWLTGGQIVEADKRKMYGLFAWLDETDLSPWLSLGQNATCDESTCPSSLARFYYGVGGMRNAEIAFLDTAVSTCAREVTLSSDTPLALIEPNSFFLKKYERHIVDLVRKGCLVNVIYSVERPLADTLRSLQAWIPLYMSGFVSPYYLRGVNNRLFFHMNYVCDNCALSSEAVIGHEEDGRYYFTTRPEDVAYYQRKMGHILEKATTLLEIYRECDAGQREAFEQIEAELQAKGNGRRIGENRYRHVRVMSYPHNCTTLSVPCGETTVHFVIRHPKINYVISHMK